jgi:hypothetical protein
MDSPEAAQAPWMDDAIAANTNANRWAVLNEQYGMTVSQ